MTISRLQRRIIESMRAKSRLLNDEVLLASVEAAAQEMIQCFQNGGKVLWCGNGGSAADAQHLAAELSGRYYYDRDPLFSEALHVNTSFFTAICNDYSFEDTFSRLVKAMGKPGDVLVGLSTSGNSPNVVKAMQTATEMGVITIGFTGPSGGKMKPFCRHLIPVPSETETSESQTPRIQECHMLLGHVICEMVEEAMFPRL